MKTDITIAEKEKLDAIMIRNRVQFVDDYSEELKKPSTAMSVSQSYSSLFERMLGSSLYLFISVNLEPTRIKRALDSRKNKTNGVLLWTIL